MEEKPSVLRNVLEWVIVIAIALVAGFFIRTFVAMPFVVPTGSMEHTIEIGDQLIAEKVTLSLGQPVSVGDVVVFTNPEDSDHEYLVKRVIATEGQTVTFIGGRVFVDGEALDEDYAVGKTYALQEAVDVDIDYPYTVPEGCVWVMGDNRENSADSRYFGPVPEDSIVGVALFRYWLLNRIGGI